MGVEIAMDYVKVRWSHDYPDTTVAYFIELRDDRYETRRVQVYRDGRMEWADRDHESATVRLSERAFRPLDEINAQPQLTAESIDAEEFNTVWRQALAES
jgi:hypothetical protein